jgi:hypothetical protein
MSKNPTGVLRPIVQPVLEKWPAATMVGRWLVYGPVAHVLTGVYFDGPASKWNMSVYRCYLPLSGFSDLSTMGKSERIYLRDGEQLLFDLRSTNYASAFMDAFGRDVIEFLDARRDVLSCASMVAENACDDPLNGAWPEFDLAWSHVVGGNFASAVEAIDVAFDRVRSHKLDRLLTTRRFTTMARCKSVLKNPYPAVVGDFLRTLELEMVAHLKIQKLWTPQPFPFER